MKTCCIHNEVEKESGRISQIEEVIYNLNEHKNRQIEENRKISTRVDELETFYKTIYESTSDVLYNRVKKLEKEIKELKTLSHSHTANINILIEERTTGLSFEEAFKAFKQGKSIRRIEWSKPYSINGDPKKWGTVSMECLLANDWEVVE